MSDVNPERRYHSPIREERARETRRAVLKAARQMFAEKGYGATTVKEIAQLAGIAPQTVYSSVGSKRDLLQSLIDLMEEDAGADEYSAARAGTDDPREHIRLQVAFSRRIFSRGQDILQIARSAIAFETESGSTWQLGNRRHLEGIRSVVESWTDRDVLRPELTPERAADIFATMTSVEVFQWLVVESGWTGDDYEDWLNETLPGLLLRE